MGQRELQGHVQHALSRPQDAAQPGYDVEPGQKRFARRPARIPRGAHVILEARGLVELAGQQPLRDGSAQQYADVVVPAVGQDVPLRRTAEDRVVDLAGRALSVHVEGLERGHVVGGDRVVADLPLLLEELEGLHEDLGMLGRADVTLVQVDGVRRQPIEAGVAAPDDAVDALQPRRVALAAPPVAHLGGDVAGAAPVGQGLAEQGFALTQAVGVRGVEQVDAGVEGGVNGADGLLFAHGTPLAADGPATHRHRAHVPSRLSQSSLLHGLLS